MAQERRASSLRAIAARWRPLNEAAFRWCVAGARQSLAGGALESALRWSALAVMTGTLHGFGRLAAPELERILLSAAARLPCRLPDRAPRSGPLRWLHVMDEENTIGGDISFALRWMELDARDHRHSVVLLSQRNREGRLAEATSASGGAVTALDPDTPLTERADRLRRQAWEHADRVVLWALWSVVPVVALGIAGGPPVTLLNQASQVFWVGGSVADLVVNLRGSARRWSESYRGIDRNAVVPVPLPDVAVEPISAERRLAARRALHLPSSATMLLTIGNAYKYRPLPGIDFLDAVDAVLRARPDVHLVAVGPIDDQRWAALRSAAGGRVVTAGPQTDLGPYHLAADLYLEGFPVGSPTAFLEVAQLGIPCVRAPRMIPPPFVIDSPALEGLAQPADVADYVRTVIALVDDPDARSRQGGALAAAVRRHHSPAPWRRALAAALASLPPRHAVYPLEGAAPLPGALRDFSAAVPTFVAEHEPLPFVLAGLQVCGLRPPPSLALARLLWRSVRADPGGAFAGRRDLGALLEPFIGARARRMIRRVVRNRRP